MSTSFGVSAVSRIAAKDDVAAVLRTLKLLSILLYTKQLRCCRGKFLRLLSLKMTVSLESAVGAKSVPSTDFSPLPRVLRVLRITYRFA
jgi:hypothetical protein